MSCMTLFELGRRLLTLDEVAERLGQSRNTVKRKVQRGEIPSVQPGGKGSAFIRCLWHHGNDPAVGFMVLGPIRRLETDTRYEVELFDVDYVHKLLPGLRANEYGVSFRFGVVRDEIEQHPKRSAFNPQQLPQITVTEARVTEFGPTPFPYKGASAGVRSGEDRAVNPRGLLYELLHGAAHTLDPGERWATRSKPGCPGVIERQRVAVGRRASWESWYLEDGPPTWQLEDFSTDWHLA